MPHGGRRGVRFTQAISDSVFVFILFLLSQLQSLFYVKIDIISTDIFLINHKELKIIILDMYWVYYNKTDTFRGFYLFNKLSFEEIGYIGDFD